MSQVFKIGDRVARAYSYSKGWDAIKIPYRYDPDTEHPVGSVTDVTQKGQIIVQWDNLCPHTSKLLDPSDLLPETEVLEKLSVLEAEFNVVEAQIKIKVKEASVALVEAAELAKKVGQNLCDLHEVTSPIMSAMRSAGWSTSSLSC